MGTKIGIRREDKNVWEKRVPLIPKHLEKIAREHQVSFIIQTSKIRIFTDSEYQEAGCTVQEDLSDCSIIFAVKEIPKELVKEKTTYAFFSHTIKGQKENMPMLKRLMDLGCTLIDYEKIVDKDGKRLIFFSRHAGIAGMVDSLWAFGQRCESDGISSPFSQIKMTHEYESMAQIRTEIEKVNKEIKVHGLPKEITPMVCGFTGYGQVSSGAQEIFDLLNPKQLSPDELLTLSSHDARALYKVIFRQEDMFKRSNPTRPFDLQEYFDKPELYEANFERFLPKLEILVNGIYWDTSYPKIVTKHFLKTLYEKSVRPRVIGDISCDINGSIEATVKGTDSSNPIYVYDIDKNKAVDGCIGKGPVIMAVNNLPCELPKEASSDFSLALSPYISAIAAANYRFDFETLKLPTAIKNAVILHHGKLTPTYQYIKEFL